LQASARHGASRVGSSLAQTQKCPALHLRRAQFQLWIFSYTRHLRGARVMFLRPAEKSRPFRNTFLLPQFHQPSMLPGNNWQAIACDPDWQIAYGEVDFDSRGNG
jgi:hypothetical protein